MKSRIPLIVAVVGALLVGGATTGSTYASWTDQVTQGGDGITTGRIGFSHAESKVSFAVNKTTSTSDTVEVTVTDQSLGKNMVQRITPSVATGPGVTALLRTKASGACAGTAQPAVNLTPATQFTTCVVVTVDPNTTLTTSSVTVTLLSHQMWGSSAAGWRAPAQTFSIPVAITQPPSGPAAPSLTNCSVRKSGSARFATINWAAVSGVTYAVLLRNPATTVTASNGVEFSQGTLANDIELVVRATQGGVSATSTAYFDIKFPNETCAVVTP